MAFTPKRVILHDYGGSPQNKEGMHNPYHVLVFPDGTVRYRYPDDPYGQAAPHAAGQNNEAIGLSYAGPVGSQPTPEAMKALQQERERIQGRYGNLEELGHGEAFDMWKRGHPFARPSVDGRELAEASWRGNVGDMSRVPEAGLQPLALLGGLETPAPYNPAPVAQRPAEPVRVAEAPTVAPTPETAPTASPESPKTIQDMIGDLFREPETKGSADLASGGLFRDLEKGEEGPEHSARQALASELRPMQLKMPQPRRVDLGRLRAALQSRRA